MSSRLLSELEQDSFEPDEFVERLAWRASAQNNNSSVGVSPNSSSLTEDFDAQSLHDAFQQAIQELSVMQEKQKTKCQTLEQVISRLNPNSVQMSKKS